MDGRLALKRRAAELLIPFVRLIRAEPIRSGELSRRRLGVAGISTRGYLFAPYIAMALEEVGGLRSFLMRFLQVFCSLPYLGMCVELELVTLLAHEPRRPLQALGESIAVFPVFKSGSLPEEAVFASGTYGKEYASAKDERLVVHRSVTVLV